MLKRKVQRAFMQAYDVQEVREVPAEKTEKHQKHSAEVGIPAFSRSRGTEFREVGTPACTRQRETVDRTREGK